MADPTPAEPAKRVKRYLIPRNASSLAIRSAAVAGGLLVVALGAYAAGWKDVASPGPVASAHGTIATTCVECHQPRVGSVDLRCERCHDPLDSRRFGSAAHVLTGTDDRWKAAHADAIPCAACHVEHRGRETVLANVRDSACATCHTFGGFSRHPEFAIVRAEASSSNGFGAQFSHAGHLKTLQKTGGDRCEHCHQPTADQQGFQPIAFDRFCASCHLMNGVLTINGTEPVATSPLAPADLQLILQPAGQMRATTTSIDPATKQTFARGRQALSNLPHRDQALLDRVARLAAVLDPTGALAANRRARAERAIRATEAAARGIVAGLSPDDLGRWADTLRADLDAIDHQLAQPAGQVSADAKAKLQTLATAVASVDPALQAGLNGMATSAPPPRAAATDDELRKAFEARRAELTSLLDAIRRRGDADAQKAATDLQQRLAALEPALVSKGATALGSSGATADDAALVDRLQAIEHAIELVRREAGVLAGADLDRALAIARQQIAPGAGAEAIAARQAELTRLLDALDQTSDPILKRRIGELRSALQDLAAGTMGDAALLARRDDKARLLDRIALELDLPAGAPGPTPSVVREQTKILQAHAASLTTALAANQNASALAPIAVGAEAARKDIQALLYGCTPCHRADPDGTSLVPMRPDLHQLTAAAFSHKPHLAQTKCETCHTGVETSTSGDDPLMPKVATCQTCHNASQARATCASCHTYHAQPLTAIGVSPIARR